MPVTTNLHRIPSCLLHVVVRNRHVKQRDHTHKNVQKGKVGVRLSLGYNKVRLRLGEK